MLREEAGSAKPYGEVLGWAFGKDISRENR